MRTLIHSRMTLGVRAYDERYPHASVVLIEPRRDDHESFFSNIFSFSSRRTVCDRAYRATRLHLRERYDELAPVLARHGIGLNYGFLADEERSVWTSVGLPELAENGPPRPDDAAVLTDLGGLLERVERLAAERAVAG